MTHLVLIDLTFAIQFIGSRKLQLVGLNDQCDDERIIATTNSSNDNVSGTESGEQRFRSSTHSSERLQGLRTNL